MIPDLDSNHLAAPERLQLLLEPFCPLLNVVECAANAAMVIQNGRPASILRQRFFPGSEEDIRWGVHLRRRLFAFTL